jgi:hypothetical protein
MLCVRSELEAEQYLVTHSVGVWLGRLKNAIMSADENKWFDRIVYDVMRKVGVRSRTIFGDTFSRSLIRMVEECHYECWWEQMIWPNGKCCYPNNRSLKPNNTWCQIQSEFSFINTQDKDPVWHLIRKYDWTKFKILFCVRSELKAEQTWWHIRSLIRKVEECHYECWWEQMIWPNCVWCYA